MVDHRVTADSRLARLWNAAVAGLVLVAIVLQIILALRATGPAPEVWTGYLRGTHAFGRVVRVLSFFTIQSNILSGITSVQLAIAPRRDTPAWRATRLAALYGITITGVVYSTVLARIHEPKGVAENLVNTTVHYLVPIMMVLGWLLFGPRPWIERATVGASLAFGVLWVIYTLVRGAIWKWYPYPFVDVTTQGYARVILNVVLVAAVLAVVASLFALGDRRLPPTGVDR